MAEDNVIPFNRAALRSQNAEASENEAREASLRHHPGGKRIAPTQRCPECGHTLRGHTEAANGCAYCNCELQDPV